MGEEDGGVVPWADRERAAGSGFLDWVLQQGRRLWWWVKRRSLRGWGLGVMPCRSLL